MDSASNRTSLKWGVPGIVIQLASSFVPTLMGETNPNAISIGALIMQLAVCTIGTALLIVGLGYYAAAKGHSRWAGLLGLLSILGIIVLAVLPDRRKTPKPA